MKYKRKRKANTKVVYQNHHLEYASATHPEIILRIRRKVHFYIFKLSRFKYFNKNEAKSLMWEVIRKVKEVSNETS